MVFFLFCMVFLAFFPGRKMLNIVRGILITDMKCYGDAVTKEAFNTSFFCVLVPDKRRLTQQKRTIERMSNKKKKKKSWTWIHSTGWHSNDHSKSEGKRECCHCLRQSR